MAKTNALLQRMLAFATSDYERNEILAIHNAKVFYDQKAIKQALTKEENKVYKELLELEEVLEQELFQKALDLVEIATDIKDLEKWLVTANPDLPIAIDTETTSSNPFRADIVGLSLYQEGRKAIYVPLKHKSLMVNNKPLGEGDYWKEAINIDNYKVTELLKVALRRFDTVYHNAKYDLHILFNTLGIETYSPTWDTMLASIMINELESHSLKDLHEKYCADSPVHSSSYSFNTIFKALKGEYAYYIPIQILGLYCGLDTIKTYELYKLQKEFFSQNNKITKGLSKVLEDIEFPLVKCLIEMERNGMSIDAVEVAKLQAFVDEKIAFYEEGLARIAEQHKDKILEFIEKHSDEDGVNLKGFKLEYPVNFHSSEQVSHFLYSILKIEKPDKINVADSDRMTGVAYLQKNKDHEVISLLLELRKYLKIKTTYLNMFDEELANGDGIIHPSYNQLGARTGRLSCSEPNMQNIPRNGELNVRACLIPREDNVFISCDYSQQEIRILAHIAEDPAMQEIYKQNKDVYSGIVSEVYHLPYEECLESYSPEAKLRRYNMKQIVLSLCYGKSVMGLAETLGTSIQEATNLTKLFYSKFPNVQKHMETLQKQVVKQGFVTTLCKRVRRLPDLKLEDFELEKTNWENKKELTEKDKKQLLSLINKKRISTDKSYQSAVQKQLFDNYGYTLTDNRRKISESYRKILNTEIQGTASDMIKLAMLAIQRNKQIKELGGFLVASLHDELIIECPQKNSSKIAKLMSQIMKLIAESLLTTVPMKCDTVISKKWDSEEVKEA